MKTLQRSQRGSSLIEVLVAVLILSFGMLALGGMLAYAVQMPRLSAYRATAVAIAAGHIERMRANQNGFIGDNYKERMTFRQPVVAPTLCAYPGCTAQALAAYDKYETSMQIRNELPQGGMRLICNGGCNTLEGEMWVIWTEPSTFASMNPVNTDECPDPTADPSFAAFIDPQPRCLHVKFKL